MTDSEVSLSSDYSEEEVDDPADEIEELVEDLFDAQGVPYDFDWRDFTLPYGPDVSLTISQTRALVKVVLRYVEGGYNMNGYVVNPWTVLEAIQKYNFRGLDAPQTIKLTLESGQETIEVDASQELAMGLYWAHQQLQHQPLAIYLPDRRKLHLHSPMPYEGAHRQLALADKIYYYRTDDFLAGVQLAYRINQVQPVADK